MPNKLSGIELACEVVRFCQSGAYRKDINNLAEKAAGDDLKLQLYFLNSLKHLVSHIPESLWKEKTARKSSLKIINNYIISISQRL